MVAKASMYLSVHASECLCKQVGMCLTTCFYVKTLSRFADISCFAKQTTFESIACNRLGSLFQAARSTLYSDKYVLPKYEALFKRKKRVKCGFFFFPQLERITV